MRQTQWYVITGAPCSGKTTVIEELEQRGFTVVHEVARAYIDAQLQAGLTIAQIKADMAAFETAILQKKITLENSLPVDSTLILDRAIPDSIAYFLLSGLDQTEVLKHSSRVRYAKIFKFDRLQLETDAVRVEEELEARRLDVLIDRSYAMLGYDMIRVPLMPVEQRVNLIISHL